jgi:hypothetical protein
LRLASVHSKAEALQASLCTVFCSTIPCSIPAALLCCLPSCGASLCVCGAYIGGSQRRGVETGVASDRSGLRQAKDQDHYHWDDGTPWDPWFVFEPNWSAPSNERVQTTIWNCNEEHQAEPVQMVCLGCDCDGCLFTPSCAVLRTVE